jgi:phage-related protein
MPAIGARCHELRIQDADSTWRVVYRIDSDAVIIAEVFAKRTQTTPTSVINACRQRLRSYDKAAEGD